MQAFHDDEDLRHTPPPPYTLIDDSNIHNNEINNFNNPQLNNHFILDVDNNGPQVRQDSSYPVTGDPQDDEEEYVRWLEQQQLLHSEGLRAPNSATGWPESSDPNHIGYNNDAIGPLPPIPEEHQQNDNNRHNNRCNRHINNSHHHHRGNNNNNSHHRSNNNNNNSRYDNNNRYNNNNRHNNNHHINNHISPSFPLPPSSLRNQQQPLAGPNYGSLNQVYLTPPVLYNNNNNDLNRYAHLQPSNHNNVNFVHRNFADDNYRSSSKCPRVAYLIFLLAFYFIIILISSESLSLSSISV